MRQAPPLMPGINHTLPNIRTPSLQEQRIQPPRKAKFLDADALTNSSTGHDSSDDLPLTHFAAVDDMHERNGDISPRLLMQAGSAPCFSMQNNEDGSQPLRDELLDQLPAVTNAPETVEMRLNPAHTQREQVSEF